MKFKTTAALGLATVAIGVAVYFLDYRKQEKHEQKKIDDSQIISFDSEQINLIEVIKKSEKIVLQKSDKGWSLLEPIQDQADSNQIEELVKALGEEKTITLAKESDLLTNSDLKEYGLDEPVVVYNFKNNAGNSRKVSVGSQKNFEGNSFVRLDSENKVYVASQLWAAKADNNLMFYREKRLYRHRLADLTQLKVKSLRDQFEIKKVDGKWISIGREYTLDQNKIRDLLKKISEASIQDYVFEGEPSTSMLKEKGLVKNPVQLVLTSAESTWSVEMNQNEKEKALFAVTDRPTSVVRLDITEWEFFGNMNLDSLRDRTTLTRFNIDEVKKIFYKSNGNEISFIKENDHWKPDGALANGHVFSEAELVKTLNRIHDLEISQFLDHGSQLFKGTNMIILKTESDRLVYQINWGPELKISVNGADKDFFYARTQVDPQVFAIEKSKIDNLGFNNAVQSKESAPTEPKKEEPSL